MFNRFSTELTDVAFKTLASEPDAYERLQRVAVEDPINAVKEIRSFIEKRTVGRLKSDSPNKAMVDAALRSVRYNEIREALKEG